MKKRTVLHLDIKPSNITIQFGNNEFTAKVIDLGGIMYESEPVTFHYTKGYLPPEYDKVKDLKKGFDIWALGITFYRMFM